MIIVCKEFEALQIVDRDLGYGNCTTYAKAQFVKQLNTRKNRIFINLLI